MFVAENGLLVVVAARKLGRARAVREGRAVAVYGRLAIWQTALWVVTAGDVRRAAADKRLVVGLAMRIVGMAAAVGKIRRGCGCALCFDGSLLGSGVG